MPVGYLSLDIPHDALVSAIAEESQLKDSDLDSLRRRLEREYNDAGLAAGWALTLGRCAYEPASPALYSARDRFRSIGRSLEAAAIDVGLELLALRPAPGLERAERGYRCRDSQGHELYIADPLAAHWHALGRWGPPVRPDVERPPLLASRSVSVEALAREAEEGGIVLVCFRAGRHARPCPPLRLTRAGIARAPSLERLIRWSTLRSVGVAGERRRRCVAFEVYGKPVERLPWDPVIGTDLLAELMTRLLRDARS